MNDNITHDDIYNEFCEYNPKHAKKIIDYKPWGHMSIVIWFNNGHAYKCKRYAPGKFVMQSVSNDDIRKKFKLK